MRVVIAEDSAVVRAGLAAILADRGHQVVAAVGNGEALLAAVAEYEPDVTVVDVRMPPGYTDEGLRAAIETRRRPPGFGFPPTTRGPALPPPCAGRRPASAPAPAPPRRTGPRPGSGTCSRT